MYCKDCQYDLRSTTEQRCPECGRAFDPEDAKSFQPEAVRRRAWGIYLIIFGASWPLFQFAMLHLTRIAAWISLGHAPRAYLDDPKSINVVVSAFHSAASIFFLAGPFCLGANLFGIFWFILDMRRNRFRYACLAILLSAASWLSGLWLIRNAFDGAWFMD